jgi:hypothetical protein
MSEDPQFREKVLVTLGKLEEQGISSLDHLKRINGSIRNLYERQEETDKKLLEHQIDCPVKSVVNEIERRLSTGDHPGSMAVKKDLIATELLEAERLGEKKVNKEWLKALQPWITLAVLILLVLMMMHNQEMIKAIGIVK